MDGDGDDGDDGGGGVVAGAEQQGQQVTAAVACFSPRRKLSASPYPALIRRLHQPERQAGRQVGDRHTTT